MWVVVYKLQCLDETIKEIYVGSTINIKDRIGKHKSSCNNPNTKQYNYKVYRFIRANGGWDNWTYDILEECDVESKEDLELWYEDTWIINLNPQLNCRRARRSKKEYYEDNKERITEQRKEYYEDNKEKIAKKGKEYYQENKDKLSNYCKEKIECECGAMISRRNISAHKKTNKHKLYLGAL
jgi:hypothetical protein